MLIAFLAACASECKDPSRINGTYSVFSSVSTHDPEDAGEFPSYVPFYNGTRSWELRYVPDSGNFSVLIDGQQFEARYTEDDANCNRFELVLPKAVYSGDATEVGDTAEVTSTHTIAWTGELVWQGDALSGTYSATDTWEDTEGNSGTMTVAGTVTGSLAGGAG
jgi:hypothetical protein